jgi:rubrerythrin
VGGAARGSLTRHLFSAILTTLVKCGPAFTITPKENRVDIFEFAMQMEQDGERFYRNMAQQTGDVGVKRILGMLADDEVKHYRIVKEMRSSGTYKMRDTEILADARNVFAEMKPGDFSLQGMQVEVYKEAQDIERKSEVFYTEKAEEVSEPAQRELFLKIANEERRHYYLLDHMIEFVSRPMTWLEDAEWNHLEEY